MLHGDFMTKRTIDSEARRQLRIEKEKKKLREKDPDYRMKQASKSIWIGLILVTVWYWIWAWWALIVFGGLAILLGIGDYIYWWFTAQKSRPRKKTQ